MKRLPSSKRLSGILRQLSLALFFFLMLCNWGSGYEFDFPIRYTEPRLKLTQDPEIQDYFYDLWKTAGFGFFAFERSAFLIYDGSNFEFREWGAVINHRRCQMYIGIIPRNTIAIVHTHPNIGDPVPSFIDKKTGFSYNLIIYVLAQDGVWRYNPVTQTTTKDEDRKYWKRIKQRRKREENTHLQLVTTSNQILKPRGEIERLLVSGE